MDNNFREWLNESTGLDGRDPDDLAKVAFETLCVELDARYRASTQLMRHLSNANNRSTYTLGLPIGKDEAKHSKISRKSKGRISIRIKPNSEIIKISIFMHNDTYLEIKEFGFTENSRYEGERKGSDPKKVDLDFTVDNNYLSSVGICLKKLKDSLPKDSLLPVLDKNPSNTMYKSWLDDDFIARLTNVNEDDFVNQIQKDLNIIQNNTVLTVTERATLIKVRVGQGIFRTRLEAIEPRCRITNIDQKRHLIASHIKPWSDSDNLEKLDGNNGLLLAPHIDHLFDKGYISFEDNGDLILSEHTSRDLLNSWSIKADNYGSFNARQKNYMDYHRNEIFEKFLK